MKQIHIPKTGCRSAYNFFNIKVEYGIDIKKLNLDFYNETTFTIIRNPYDRFISCLKMFKKKGVDINTQLEYIESYDGVESVIPSGINWSNKRKSVILHSMSIFDSQLNVFDTEKKQKATYLIHFDHIIEDFKTIAPDRDYDNYPKIGAVDQDFSLTRDQIAFFQERFKEDINFYENFKPLHLL